MSICYMLICLSVYFFICLSESVSLCIPVSLSLCLSISLSSLCHTFCLSPGLPVSLFQLIFLLHYLKDVQYYYQYMLDTAILLGADRQAATSEMKDSLIFEIELATISAPREERRNVTNLYNPTTVKEIDGYPG
jgi:hypothetical protein